MNRAAPFLCLLASCGGIASRVEEVPPELRMPAAVVPPLPDRWPYEVAPGLQEGEWARYREGTSVVRLAVVGKEADGFWIETIVEGEPLQASAALVGPDGAVRRAFYCEVSKDVKSAVLPQPVVQSSGGPAAKFTELSREKGEEKVTVGGRELACRSVRVRFEDLEGRLREETTLWHPDVPRVRAGSEAGGLVRRAGVELIDFGGDAKPVVDRPR